MLPRLTLATSHKNLVGRWSLSFWLYFCANESTIDIELMYEHFVRMRHIASLSPFKELVARELNPGPDVTSEEDLKLWIKKTCMTIYRTCLPRVLRFANGPEH
jgi:hypothetical protein